MDFRSQQAPRGDPQVNVTLGLVSPPRNGNGPLLPRRFTTDSGRVPTLSTISTTNTTTTSQRAPEPQDFASTTALHKVQLLEKKRQDYERLREHRRRFEAEMQKLEAQQRQEEQELQQMQEDLNHRLGGGHQSEPTTPPEFHDMTSGYGIWSSRPNRYSTSSLTSVPLYNRPGRSDSLLASPQSGTLPSRYGFDDGPSRSVPGSRRNSDEDDDKEEAVRQDPTSHRSTNALNRYSMPVTKSRTYLGDIGLEDSSNIVASLFRDEDNSNMENETTPTGQVAASSFRHQAYSALTSSSSTLDLAPSQILGAESTSLNGWNSVPKHQQRQSMSTIGSTVLNGAPSVGSAPSEAGTIGSRPTSIRHSLDGLKYLNENISNPSDTPTSVVSPPQSHAVSSPPKLQQSYSANDVVTLKSNGSGLGSGLGSNANIHAQQHFQNHNASIGRIPAGAMNRHGREMSGDAHHGREAAPYQSISSALHAQAPTFGPPSNQQNLNHSSAMNNGAPPLPYQPYYPGQGYNPATPINGNTYNSGVNMLMHNLQNISLTNSTPPTVYNPNTSPQNYTGYNALFGSTRPHQDSQARVMANRRQQDSEAMARFQNMDLQQATGQIYGLCKDQHGCRFLQKQLENRIPEQIHMIWLETREHVIELMTDPFGNYLVQKLLELCTEQERTALVQNAAPDMAAIALNQHGTRALQKMIEHVTTDTQVKLIVEALRYQVVELIQDLNGNHVIQKCLNKLSSADSAFIFEAVGNHCVEVGTHRHGCCVLQRCIDHADGPQKVWLIERITANAVALVQDPFGNYVVQYIIDLNEDAFTEPLVRTFQGRIVSLSKHKFSSNVVEKCLRCAGDVSRDMIVTELMEPGEMERLLRDSFANYVIQTALEYASLDMKMRLVDCIRPSLAAIRSTPYGRRISGKIQSFDTRVGGVGVPSVGNVAIDQTSGQVAVRSPPARGNPMPSNFPSNGNTGYTNGANSSNGMNGNGNRGGTIMYPSPGSTSGSSHGHGQAPPQPPRTQRRSSQFAPGGPIDNGTGVEGSSWF
ncbi:armadillo-type protein [Podospora australis]|uniref:Armadillo-type protein n=1 Tax=Podospora australis TaxID=1536484 RepID=A0AAN6WTN9_9PEZI|nr:armadillo-type protein [Podospora australis]